MRWLRVLRAQWQIRQWTRSENAQRRVSLARIAAEPGAKPCPVCKHRTPDVRSKPPCYLPYAGRRADCPAHPSALQRQEKP